jgi:hypothetical protein
VKKILLTFWFFAGFNFSNAITVYQDSVVNRISPFLFGAGDEINQNLSVAGLDSLVLAVKPAVARFGGISLEYEDWEADTLNGITYYDFLDSIMPVLAEYGIDSILQFCERNQIEPVLSVPFQINDPAKAARMVEYCNAGISTAMGALRAQRGHPQPYNVSYWCIGNEPDISGLVLRDFFGGDWTLYRHFGIPFANWTQADSVFMTEQQYAGLVSAYIDSMRLRSPLPLNIGIGVAGNKSWLLPALTQFGSKIDWVDLHAYPCSNFPADSNGYRDCFAQLEYGAKGFYGIGIELWYRFMRDTIQDMSGGKSTPLHIMEYNTGGFAGNYNPWWYNYLNGIFIADFIGRLAKAGAPMASFYNIYEQTVRPDDLAMIRGDMLSLRTSGWVIMAYRRFFGGELIKTVSTNPNLSGYSCLKNGDSVVSFVINKNLDSAFTDTVRLYGPFPPREFNIWQIANDTVISAPWNGTKGIVYHGRTVDSSGSFRYSFPKHSLTIISAKSGLSTKVESFSGAAVKFYTAPNPFNPVTKINFNLPEKTFVTVSVYNLKGERVQLLAEGVRLPGTYHITWNASDVSGGVYFFKLRANGFETVQRGLLLK